MPGHPFYSHGGTDTVEVSVPVAKGQGLEADPTPGNEGKARPWSALSITRAGVAQIPGRPAAGNAYNDMSPMRPHVTVQRAPMVTRLKFAGNAKWRQALVAAADGEVAAAAVDATAQQILGYCDEPAGVLAGATGTVELI